MSTSLSVEAYIVSCKRNTNHTVISGTAGYRKSQTECVIFSYKYFPQTSMKHIDNFFERDIVNITGKFTYVQNDQFLPDGIFVVIHQATLQRKASSINDLRCSIPFITFSCQLSLNTKNQPIMYNQNETSFINTYSSIYCHSSSSFRDHYFTLSYKSSNPYFRTIWWNKATLYSINGFLNDIFLEDEKIIFLIEICAVDHVSLNSLKRSPIISQVKEKEEKKEKEEDNKDDIDEYLETKKTAKKRKNMDSAEMLPYATTTFPITTPYVNMTINIPCFSHYPHNTHNTHNTHNSHNSRN
ncbi:hypothetical protein Glove_50g109 [Diversispora epigaea]|uniref:Uncharacterized protein n=1 Tax=Diversispora epigaea TaxID=1348612 RepID=A0A397JMW4_9GLOM|nr:hypothetical protein Glove_50g109 [Diversispora epigaea]